MESLTHGATEGARRPLPGASDGGVFSFGDVAFQGGGLSVISPSAPDGIATG
jgi:hypothetical protein